MTRRKKPGAAELAAMNRKFTSVRFPPVQDRDTLATERKPVPKRKGRSRI